MPNFPYTLERFLYDASNRRVKKDVATVIRFVSSVGCRV
jgi:hypothetical protein